MTINEIREKYIKFFTSSPRDHAQIKPSPLVLKDDPTTLFTSSGMQPLVPYLMGEKHQDGKRLVNSQPAIRLQDIEEVGDMSHTTFFEMLGNWSLGDYFKEEHLAWFWEFLIKELGLPKERLYVSVFKGDGNVAKDDTSAEIWRKLGVSEERIIYHGVEHNWWSRSGVPDMMPAGELGGPDSEVFFEFPQVEHDKKYGDKCEPGCDCGRFLEVGNSVFMQYKKTKDGSLEELPNKNVDFGGGLERLAAASIDNPDVFMTDVFQNLIGETEKNTGKDYKEAARSMRIIADHVRASVFLAANNVVPSNKEHGYVLRRLIRRSSVKVRQLKGSIDESLFEALVSCVVDYYEGVYLTKEIKDKVNATISDEVKKFRNTLERGLKEIEKIDTIDAKKAFDLYQSYGFPVEITEEIFEEKGQEIDKERFNQEFEKHKNLSRTTSAGKFKGGLAGESEKIKKLHTTAHILQAVLKEMFGNEVNQKGQNITEERLRFDFFSKTNPEGSTGKIENEINKKISAALPVQYVQLNKEEAIKTGATHLFDETYPDIVKVYFIGDDIESAFSKEFCGGPHVSNTAEIEQVKVKKSEKIGADTYRIYITLD